MILQTISCIGGGVKGLKSVDSWIEMGDKSSHDRGIVHYIWIFLCHRTHAWYCHHVMTLSLQP